jgi:Tol biopolymer transport system component
VPVYQYADLNGAALTVLPDGTRVWLTGTQSFDGTNTYAEVYFEANGQYLAGWVLLDYLPGVPNTIITPTYTPAAYILPNTIAYVSGLDGAWQIYLHNIDRTWALPNQPANSGVPAWSPDHQWLAFRSSAGGNWQVYKIRPDGSELTRLTYDGQNYEPNWSPDGSQILFVSDRDGNKEIYLMNADGSNQTRLTNNDVVDDDPCWSPAGNALVFESKRNDHMDVYWMALNDPANQVPLTSGGVYNGTPAWSPDGQKILYERQEGSETHLWLIYTSDWSTSQFTYAGTTNHRPAWSADGNYVAYTSDESGGWQIHVINFFDGVSSPIGDGYDAANGW